MIIYRCLKVKNQIFVCLFFNRYTTVAIERLRTLKTNLTHKKNPKNNTIENEFTCDVIR